MTKFTLLKGWVNVTNSIFSVNASAVSNFVKSNYIYSYK
jgi:hypothetical protein